MTTSLTNLQFLAKISHVFNTKLDTFMPQLACYLTKYILYKCELHIKTIFGNFWNIQLINLNLKTATITSKRNSVVR